jgi:hypothetical protein
MKQYLKSAVYFGTGSLAQQVGLAISNRLRWQTTPDKPLVKPHSGGRSQNRLHVHKALMEYLLPERVST